MTRRFSFVLLAGLGAHACQYDQDVVLPGYYAQDGGAKTLAQVMAPAAPAQEVQLARARGSQRAADAGLSSESRNAGGSSQAGMPASTSSLGIGDANNGAGNPQGTETQANEAASTAGSMADSMPMPSMSSGTPAGECDLTGRWLATSHLTTDALGTLQTVHYYEYLEIEQQSDAFTVTRGFMCSSGTSTDSALSASVDFSAAEATYPTRVRYDGRPGTSAKVADGCQVKLETWYTVRGATIPFYLDPANKLPTADEPATGTTPGWEDWDGDGNPGVTGYLSGVVSGEIYVAPRMWTAMSGTVKDTSLLRLSVKWGQEQNVMAYKGSPLLATQAAIGPDPASHFAQLARLSADQAKGDEAAICAAMKALAPQLTPEAAGS